MSITQRVFAAALTPFDDNLNIDRELLVRHCHALLREGCDGISPFGTTGEANSMSVPERMLALEDILAGGVPAQVLIPGTGYCSIIDTVSLTKHAIQHGVFDVLVLPPFFYKNVSDDGVFDAYSYIIDAVGDSRLRLYLYHIPQYSGVPLSVALIERLRAAYPNIIAGIKDSAGDLDGLRAFCALPDLRVFVGAERLIDAALSFGAAGTICALGNVSSSTLASLCARPNEATASALQRRLIAEIDLVNRYGFIPALKALLAEKQSIASWARVRPPLRTLPVSLWGEASRGFESFPGDENLDAEERPTVAPQI